MPKNTSDKVSMVRGAFKEAGPFKFKHKFGRDALLFDFDTIFGFIPRKIVIQLTANHNEFMLAAEDVATNRAEGGGGDKIIVPKKGFYVPKTIGKGS